MPFSRPEAAVAAVLTLAVVGCGTAQAPPQSPTGQTPAQPPGSSQPTIETAHNDTDVAFAQQMIPHHAQAITMADTAITYTTSPKVRELAENIKKAQQPEIDQMTGWLRSWGADVPSTSTNALGGMDHGTGGSMPGMMSPEQMQQMVQASGAQFDRMFLQMMIEHHQGAIEMAQTEVNAGQNSESTQLAQKIIIDQQAEITEMRALLQEA